MSLGSYSAVVVSDYENAKELLSHSASLARPPKFFDVLPEKGGMVGMSGVAWQEQRRFCGHALYKMGRGSGLWEKIIKKDVGEVVEYFQKFEGKPRDVSYLLGRSIRSNVMGLLLGKQFTEKETNPDVQVIERAFFVTTELYQTTNPAALMPWLLKYLVKFNIAGYADKMKTIDELDSILRCEIKKRLEGEALSDSADFIDHYLALSNKRTTGESENYTLQNLIGNLAALFFGGTNSTVASILWLLVLMAAYPEVQAKVHDELDKEIGKDEDVEWDDRKRLPYTMATILEMQRWATVVPFYPPRWVSETFEFRAYKIPKGTVIFTNGWEIHHNPKYWDNPHSFIPERFVSNAGIKEADSLRFDGHAPFSFGKRNCPGVTAAVMMLFLYFSGLMQKFTVKSPPGCQADVSTHFRSVIYPKGQELCFIRRK